MSVPERPKLAVTTRSEGQTRRFGRLFARRFLRAGGRAALRGDLGAGKTVFVRGAAEAFGLGGRITSPTFALMNELPVAGRRVRWFRHLDLYRLSGGEEVRASGLDEALAEEGTVCFVEWPERAWTLVPRPFYRVEFSILTERMRRIEVFEVL